MKLKMTNFPINHHHFGGCTPPPNRLRACVGEYQYSRHSGRSALGTVQSQVNKKTSRVKQEKAL